MVSSEGACAAYYNYGRFLVGRRAGQRRKRTEGQILKAQKREGQMSENDSKTGVPDFSGWSCPLPLAGYPTIVMGHGGGGKLGNELVEHLFSARLPQSGAGESGRRGGARSGRAAAWR
jgi:hypothetical protein